MVKHKSKLSCASAIFYDLGSKVAVQNWHYDYTYNMTVPPVIQDGGWNLLLASFHGPRSLKCNTENGGFSKPALKTLMPWQTETSFVIVNWT